MLSLLPPGLSEKAFAFCQHSATGIRDLIVVPAIGPHAGILGPSQLQELGISFERP